MSDAGLNGRLLITGATGFIGSRLALHVHRAGADVVATGRAESDVEKDRLRELEAAGVPVIIGSLQDDELCRRITDNRTHVMHLAAAQHESEMPDAYFRSVNVDGTRRLLEACRRSGVRRFVYGSTMGVYGGLDPAATPAVPAFNEASPTRPENIYTRTKLAAEDLVRDATAFETCIVRIVETYGPSDRRLLKLFRAIDRGQFFMIGGGTNLRQCIHVSDLARGLLLALERPEAAGETLIFAGPRAMNTTLVVQHIAAALGRRPPRVQLPLWPFVVAASVMERTLPPLHIQPPLHSRRLDFFRKSFAFDTSKTRALLGFEPKIDFAAGASDTVRWYRARGLLTTDAKRTDVRTEPV